VTVLGPVFETTIVYVIVEPWGAEPTVPEDPPSLSVKVIATSPWLPKVSLSEALTVEASEALAAAVFT
jgi:hypothetical protein